MLKITNHGSLAFLSIMRICWKNSAIAIAVIEFYENGMDYHYPGEAKLTRM